MTSLQVFHEIGKLKESVDKLGYTKCIVLAVYYPEFIHDTVHDKGFNLSHLLKLDCSCKSTLQDEFTNIPIPDTVETSGDNSVRHGVVLYVGNDAKDLCETIWDDEKYELAPIESTSSNDTLEEIKTVLAFYGYQVVQ